MIMSLSTMDIRASTTDKYSSNLRVLEKTVMKRLTTSVATFATSILMWSALPATAAWSDDPTVNLALSTAESSQKTFPSSAVSDGAGGAIVVWVHAPYTAPDIWAQRVTADGEIPWEPDGEPVCTAAGTQSEIRVINDGGGGAIVIWRDRRGADYDYYAQRIDGDGDILWPIGSPSLDGVPVCTVAGDQGDMEAVPDGAGGVIVVWRHDDPADDGLYAQRLDPSGARMWPDGAPDDTGAIICDHPHAQFWPSATPDGTGGVIVAWNDSRNSATTNHDIFAQKLNSDGVRQWIPDGVPICLEDLGQTRTEITNDNSGGAIITWQDPRPSGSFSGIYAQRVSSTGIVLWPPEGIEINETIWSSESTVRMVGDGQGGAYIVWLDNRADTNIYAQRINGLGNTLWTAAGAPVVTAADSQSAFDIVSGGPSGVFVSWTDARADSTDIYAQHLDGTGAPTGTVDGLEVCTNEDYQSASTIAGDGAGGVIVAWYDYRNNTTTGTDIYAHHPFDGGLIFGDDFEGGDTGEWDGVFP